MKILNSYSFSSIVRRAQVRREQGAELLEYALLLPLLLVVLVGLLDFALAYNVKDKLSNAAREGARLGSSEPLSDLQNNPGVCAAAPPSIVAVKDAVVSYLTDAGINTSFIGSTISQTGNCTWAFYSSGTYGLTVQKPYPITMSNGTTKGATFVTLNYPYTWTFGFNNILKMIAPSSTISGVVTIPVNAIMVNL